MFLLRDKAVFQHLLQHRIASAQRIFRIVYGIIGIRPAACARQGSRLSQGKIFATLSEVLKRSGLNPIGADAQERLIQVQLQDLILSEVTLHLHGHQGFT